MQRIRALALSDFVYRKNGGKSLVNGLSLGQMIIFQSHLEMEPPRIHAHLEESTGTFCPDGFGEGLYSNISKETIG